MAIKHVYSNNVADGTNTNVVRPSDWNSYHNQFSTLSGNTAGQSTLSGTNIVLQAGNNITLSGVGNTVVISGQDAMASNAGSNFINTSQSSLFQLTSNTSIITSNAFPSANTTKFVGTGFTGTNASATLNSNGLQLSVANPGAGTTSYYNQIAAGGSTITSGTVVFSNSNGVSFGFNGSTLTATVATNYQSQGAYLTTAMQSNAGSSFVGLNSALTGNGVSATINSSGISLNVPAFDLAANTSNYQLTSATSAITSNAFANSATTKFAGTGTSATNASVTLDSNGLQISVAATVAQTQQPMYFSASGTNTSGNTLQFGNTNGVSFGLSNGSIIATVATNYLTTAMASNAGSSFIQTSQSSLFDLTANVSNYQLTSNTSAITSNAFANSATTKFAGTGFTGTNASATFNSNGLQLSVGGGGAGGITNINVSAGATSNNLSALTFNNSNGVSFGLAGSVITATVATNYQSQGAYLTTAMASNASTNFAGTTTAATNCSVTANTGGIRVNVPNFATGNAGLGFSGTNVSGTINSNGISLSAAAGGGGGGVTMSDWMPVGLGASTVTAFGQNSLSFCPIMPPSAVAMSAIEMLWTGTFGSTSSPAWSHGKTISYGLYSENGSSVSLIGSSSLAISVSASSNLTVGITMSQGTNSQTYSSGGSDITAFNQANFKIVSLPFATTITGGGLYFFGYNFSSATSGTNVGFGLSHMANNEITQTTGFGAWNATGFTASNKSIVQEPYGFIYSASTAGLGASYAYSDMSGRTLTQPYLYFEA